MCDCCYKFTGEETSAFSVMNQRKKARLKGWIYSQGRDLCPDCRPRAKSGELPRSHPVGLKRNRKRRLQQITTI